MIDSNPCRAERIDDGVQRLFSLVAEWARS